MQEFLSKYKNTLIGAGILIVVFGGFMWWKSGSSGGTETDLSTLSIAEVGLPQGLSSEASRAGQEILVILNELKLINLDGRVFESAVFKSLVDYSIATTSEPRGRPDPFEPLPFESAKEDNK